MNPHRSGILLGLSTTVSILLGSLAHGQPAKGAGPAFERVKEVMSERAKSLRISGAPDQDFAQILLSQQEDAVFLARTQLEFGGDAELRELAQRLADENTARIDLLKKWQIKNGQTARQQNVQAQPSAQSATARMAPEPAKEPSATSADAAPAANLPLVTGKVEKVDAQAGRVTIEHGAIPNLKMDGMTMVFRVQDKSLLQKVKVGDTIRFSADRVQGQITLVRIEGAR